MKLRKAYVIRGTLYDEALRYAKKSRAYTSNRHDFHAGGLDNKQRKMLEGKLGEKAVKLLLEDNGVRYLDNYVMYDSDLRPMADLEPLILNRFKKEK